MENAKDVAGIAPERQEEFRKFLSTGDATPEFMKYLESDPGAQAAVEKEFDRTAEAFKGLAEALGLKKNNPPRRSLWRTLGF